MTQAAAMSKSEQAYRWIRENIVNGAYGAGYRLVLSDLAAQLSMSVVPVREAIRQLTAEGLVTFEHNVGARVARVDHLQYRDAMQVISVVESAATALAARHLTAADLSRARALNDTMRAGMAEIDPRSFSTLNQEFHRTLYLPCPNPRLLEIVETEWARLSSMRDSIFTIVPGRAPKSVDEHDNLIELIETAAPLDQIENAVRQHRANSLSAVLNRIQGT
ncbi:GntR family transcriptional regulator [Hamadaea sp. NPDC051192]|uniref:GntR family transcriptional regulator n=1 Tax=Hamadaea sp. NPDC051192 TaxID=3154940 RepID=UPI00343357E7